MLRKRSFHLFLIFLIAAISRFYFIRFPSFATDMADYMYWTQRLVQITPFNFYTNNYFSDYFPGYLYILWGAGSLFHIFSSNTAFTSHEFDMYLKLVNALFDFGTAYLIYKIVKRYNPKWSIIALIFYLFNPVVIFNSSVWGQSDGVYTFFLVVSAFYLIEKRQSLNWSIWSAVSIIVKPQSVATLPIAMAYQFKQNVRLKIISLFLIPLLLIVFALPFFHKDPILGLYHLAKTSTGLYPYTSEYAYNLWALASWWKPDSTRIIINYQTWGILLFSLEILYIIFPVLKKKNNFPKQSVYLGIALSLMAFFMFLTRMHERYLFPFFAFMLIAAGTYKSRTLLVLYSIFSLIHFANLWYVYYYYNFVYSHPAFSMLLPYVILNNSATLLIVSSLVLFALLFFEYYSYFVKEHDV